MMRPDVKELGVDAWSGSPRVLEPCWRPPNAPGNRLVEAVDGRVETKAKRDGCRLGRFMDVVSPVG